MSKTSWDRMSAKGLASLRDERIRRQFRYQLYAFSPFYRKEFDRLKIETGQISRMADLPKAPLVPRSVLAEAAPQFFLRPTRQLIQKYGAPGQLMSVSLEMILHGSHRSEQLVRSEYEPVHELSTAGTRGDPIRISLSKRDLTVLAEQGKRMLEVAGVKSADRLVNLLPNSPSGGFWTTWLGGVALGVRQVAAGEQDPVRAFRAAVQEEATVIIGEAGLMLEMLKRGREMASLKTIVLAPRPVDGGTRRALQEAAGSEVKIIGTYHFAEGRAVWAECAEGGARGGYHTYPDLEVFEMIASDTSAPMAPSEGGELVFSGLDQRGTALARYRPGDMVTAINSGPCPFCGRNVDRIMGPITRVGRVVRVRVAGGAPVDIDPVVLAGVIAHPDLAAWQLEINRAEGSSNGSDDLCVLFKPKGEKDPAALAVELDAVLRRRLGLSPQFVLSDRAAGGVVDLR